MSSSSDSDEFFFDAEEAPPAGQHAKRLSYKERSPKPELEEASVPVAVDQRPEVVQTEQNNAPKQAVEKPPEASLEVKTGRKRFRELRQKMQTDDEDGVGNASPPDSQTSSVEGLCGAANRASHPFRVIEQDTVSLQSINSLGRVGRILSGQPEAQGANVNKEKEDAGGASTSTLSSNSHDSESTHSSASRYPSTLTLSNTCPCNMNQSSSLSSSNSLPIALQEPDVVASTKGASSSQAVVQVQEVAQPVEPVAPPRRKKKGKAPKIPIPAVPKEEEASNTSSLLGSPASTIESLTKEFEHSLDSCSPVKTLSKSELHSKSEESSRSSTIKSAGALGPEFSMDIRQATKGQYVVKPQDEEGNKAEAESARRDRMREELLGAMSNNSIGRGSLGSHRNHRSLAFHQGSKERRRSAGDEEMMRQMNMFVRTRTDSGKQLTDLEILEQVTVLNLDTGERVPLSIAEDKLPQCVNPLSLHIMRLTSEYVSNSALDKEKESDEESVESKRSVVRIEDVEADLERPRRRAARIKHFFGSTVKKTKDKVRSIAQEVSHARHKEDDMDIPSVVNPGEQNIKLKTSNSHKGPCEFENTQHVQELSGEHAGPVWCMKFSCCGRLLATAGQDKLLRVWVVRDAFPFFQDMRTKYNADKVSPTPSQESLMSQHSSEDTALAYEASKSDDAHKHIFVSKPFCIYTGHTSDLLDVAWCKNYFILSSSMDKTVRLWHISRKECLCCFQHIEFVTAIAFHPRDDRYFLSGSLDGKLRLWNIPDKKVAVWTEVAGQKKLITAANFCQNGKFAVAGTYDGRCIFYITDQLKYHTQIHVKSKRGKNSHGRKICGIEPMPGEDKILVTSNDSRIRLYDLRDLNVSCKYKGYVNASSHIKASFSHDGKYIVSGSENRDVYIWKTHHDYSKFTSVRRDRNDFWEAIKAHNAVVTCAVFAPNPDAIIKMIDEQKARTVPPDQEKVKNEDPVVEQRNNGCGGHVLVSVDFNGCIKVFLNRMKPKHSSLPASALQ